MASLQNGLERIDEKINKLITLNQKTYLRENKDEGDIKPTGTSWNLENQNEMFHTLMEMTKEMEYAKQKLKSIF